MIFFGVMIPYHIPIGWMQFSWGWGGGQNQCVRVGYVLLSNRKYACARC